MCTSNRDRIQNSQLSIDRFKYNQYPFWSELNKPNKTSQFRIHLQNYIYKSYFCCQSILTLVDKTLVNTLKLFVEKEALSIISNDDATKTQ
jgi:hypothetical protein